MIKNLFAEFKQTMQTNNATSQGQATYRRKILSEIVRKISHSIHLFCFNVDKTATE